MSCAIHRVCASRASSVHGRLCWRPPVGRKVALATRCKMIINRFAQALLKALTTSSTLLPTPAPSCRCVRLACSPVFPSPRRDRRQIHYVDVIAHASTVFGRIILPKIASESRRPTATWAMYGIDYSECLADLRPYRPTDARQRVEVAQQGNAPVRLGFLQIGRICSTISLLLP